MNVRVTLLVWLLSALVPIGVAAENIPLRVLREVPDLHAIDPSTIVTIGSELYTNGKVATLLYFNWNSGRVDKRVNLPGQDRLWGAVGGKLILERWDARPNPDVQVFLLYDPASGKIVRRIPKMNPQWHLHGYAFGYENNLAFISKLVGRGEGSYTALHTVNIKTGALKPFHLATTTTDAMDFGQGFVLQRAPIDGISPDKQHLLVGPPYQVLDIAQAKVVGSFTSSVRNDIQVPEFVTSSLIFDGKSLRNLSGNIVATTVFSGVPDKIDAVEFSPDLRHALVSGDTSGIYYVDSTAFRNYIERLGYLFHPTTGVMTSSEVNFRQYPNLKAKVIGSLNTGEKLDVLDRSGSKQKIEGYDSYWYKVKTAGGTVGWMYGAFIKLAKPSSDKSSSTN